MHRDVTVALHPYFKQICYTISLYLQFWQIYKLCSIIMLISCLANYKHNLTVRRNTVRRSITANMRRNRSNSWLSNFHSNLQLITNL